MSIEIATAATTGAAPEPTDALAGVSLEALAAYREAQDKANRADDAFRASVHPKVWEAHKEIVELDQRARDATGDMWIAELCRHFPAFAPALRLTWEHIIDTRLDRIGSCCTDGGPIEP